jgi:hypothetical protein
MTWETVKAAILPYFSAAPKGKGTTASDWEVTFIEPRTSREKTGSEKGAALWKGIANNVIQEFIPTDLSIKWALDKWVLNELNFEVAAYWLRTRGCRLVASCVPRAGRIYMIASIVYDAYEIYEDMQAPQGVSVSGPAAQNVRIAFNVHQWLKGSQAPAAAPAAPAKPQAVMTTHVVPTRWRFD